MNRGLTLQGGDKHETLVALTHPKASGRWCVAQPHAAASIGGRANTKRVRPRLSSKAPRLDKITLYTCNIKPLSRWTSDSLAGNFILSMWPGAGHGLLLCLPLVGKVSYDCLPCLSTPPSSVARCSGHVSEAFLAEPPALPSWASCCATPATTITENKSTITHLFAPGNSPGRASAKTKKATLRTVRECCMME